MSGGNDLLLVEDWSTFEKSMLQVLREERRTRLKLVPVERAMSAEDLRRFVHGKAVEPSPFEPSIVDAAAPPTDFVVCPDRGERIPLPAAFADAALRVDSIAELTRILLPGERDEPVPQSPAVNYEVVSADATTESASVASHDHPVQHMTLPAASEPHDLQPADATATTSPSRLTYHASLAAPAPRAAFRWRVPLLVSLLILFITGAAIAVVKPGRGPNRAPEAAVSQGPHIDKDSTSAASQPALIETESTAAVNSIPAPASDQRQSEKEAPLHNERQVSRDRVRMRGGPALDAPVLTMLSRGAAVSTREQSEENGWCRVQAGDGREGWMRCDFLRAPGQNEPQVR